MACKECNAPTILTPEEAEVCTYCGLLQEAFFQNISMEVERYVTARAEYHSFDDYSTSMETFGGSQIASGNYCSKDEHHTTLLNQQKQQKSSKSVRITRLQANLKAICYKHFNESVSSEASKILIQYDKQWRNANQYHVFGACIYLACQTLSKLSSFVDIANAVNDSANCYQTCYSDIGKLVKKITSSSPPSAIIPVQAVMDGSNHNLLPIYSPMKQESLLPQKNEKPSIPAIMANIIEDKSLSKVTKNGNSHSNPNKTQSTIEGIMTKHYQALQLEYSILQKAISLIPKYLYELEGRKPATVAAACFLKASNKLTIQTVGKVLRVSRPTLTSALKLCK